MILVISNMYPSDKYPNYGVFVKNFVDELSNSYETKVISITKKESKKAKLFGYLHFYWLITKNYIFGNFDLIYVHYAGYNAPPVLLGKLFNKKTPLIVNVHGSDVTPEKKLEERTNFLTRMLVHRADLTVVPSTYFQKVVVDKYGDVPTYVSPSSGINLSLFQPHQKRKNTDEFTLGYVSRIDQDKGWDILLEAVHNLKKDIPNIRLIMVGGGAQENDAIKKIDDLKLNDYVTKIKMLSQSELVEIYNSLDAFIFPSTRDGESLGLVGLEAMACGIPVIGSDFGGIQTYTVDGHNGFLFKPGSCDDLEKKIMKFYRLNIQERSEFSNNAIHTAANYDSNVVNERLIEKLATHLNGR
ncbi:putative GlcNAc transferase [Weissella koreensis KCTC 3621]|uniref:glycosyltransferase n=1 Tax=Weissella koreensis TaxID=165096 RepID=UPI00026F24A8|nr:glycosyltransferase [Weissella koreensis]EJF33468.1 putative GlcNAc transferase [Weissella koreensis KCTC 3621]